MVKKIAKITALALMISTLFTSIALAGPFDEPRPQSYSTTTVTSTDGY